MSFISSSITPVEEPRLVSSKNHRRYRQSRPAKLRKLGLNSGFLAIMLSVTSMFGVFGGLFGTQNFASAAELVGTSPGIGSTLNSVPEQVIFGFDAPLKTFGTALYVNAKRYGVGVAQRGRDAQEAILSLSGLNYAGTYEVFWEATAEDGIVTKGKIRFVVKAPAKQRVPVTTPAPPAATAAPAAATLAPLPAEATTANTVATPAGETPSAYSPTSATATLPPTPDTVLAAPVTIVVAATAPTKATAKPKPTKAPKTIPTIARTTPQDSSRVTTPNSSRVPTPNSSRVETPNSSRVPTPKATKTTTSTVPLPARAPTTPTLGDTDAVVSGDTVAARRGATSSKPGTSAKPTSPPKPISATSATSATGSAEIVFETAIPSTDTQAPASTKKTSNPGKKATPTSITVTAVPAPAVATVGVSPTLAESPLPNPTVPALAPTTTKRPKPTTTTTTILLSPDTVPASDIEVSVEGGDGSTVQETGQTGIADPSTTRKKLPSITDELEGTTTAPNPLAPPVTKPLDLRDPVAATSTLPTARPAAVPTAVTGNPDGPAVTKSASNPAASNPAATNNGVTDSSVINLPAPDRPRTEAEIVSGTDAHSPDAGTTTAIGSSSTPQASASPMKAGRLRGPLKLAGAGTLAALLLGLVAMFASLRAPITAFARQRLLHGFGLGLALAILTIAAIAIARELLNTPRSWPRVALKGLGFAALTAFAFVRRRSMKRGLSIVSEHFPSAKNVRVHSSIDGVAASRELDEHLPKSLRLGNVTGRRAKGRHIPELVRRLQKASLVEAIFAAVALLVAGFLLFV